MFFKHLIKFKGTIAPMMRESRRFMSAQVIRTPMPLAPEQVVEITNRVKDESNKAFDENEEYILRQMVSLSKKHIVCDDGLKYILKAVDCSYWIMEAALLRKVIKRVVVPTLWRKEEDEAVFKEDFRSFLIQDTDEVSRRGLARQIFRGIVFQGDEVARTISYQEILLLLRRRSLWNWQKFECGIDLVVCWLESGMDINIAAFVKDHTMVEGVLAVPNNKNEIGILMLKAVCLKLVREASIRFPVLSPWGFAMLKVTGHNVLETSNVVQFYAATCTVELLMAMRRRAEEAGLRADEAGIFDHRSQDMLTLMASLFRAMEIPGSEENEHLMQCIHLILRLTDFGEDINQRCFNHLLQVCCNETSNQEFSKYSFKSLAVLVQRDASYSACLEKNILPEMILKNGITDASLPLLAQLLELTTPPISPIYMDIFLLILQPETWKTSCNFKDLLRFLKAFLHKAPGEANDKLSQVLWVIEELVSSPITEYRGFHLLRAVVQNLDYIEENLTEANTAYLVKLCARYKQP